MQKPKLGLGVYHLTKSVNSGRAGINFVRLWTVYVKILINKKIRKEPGRNISERTSQMQCPHCSAPQQAHGMPIQLSNCPTVQLSMMDGDYKAVPPHKQSLLFCLPPTLSGLARGSRSANKLNHWLMSWAVPRGRPPAGWPLVVWCAAGWPSSRGCCTDDPIPATPPPVCQGCSYKKKAGRIRK